ncbi:MAG: cupin domain-containing protein [Rhizobiaceae bacterium]|nr:cupin domain-containing protein [Rhizobiaceae bacterium]
MNDVSHKGIICLPPGGGRRYEMGRLTALFKADGSETDEAYSASEWLLDPGQPGVGAHKHERSDEIFLVLEGNPEFLLDDAWRSCPAGSFLRIPAGVTHNFRNFGPLPARLFSMFVGAGFEHNMPAIIDWFAAREEEG